MQTKGSTNVNLDSFSSTKLETNYESLSNNHHPPTSTPNGPGSGGPQSEDHIQQAKESIKSEAETIQNSTVKPIHNYPDYYQQHYGNPHHDLSSAFINCKQTADFSRSSAAITNNHHPTQPTGSAPPVISDRPSNSNSKSNKNRPTSGMKRKTVIKIFDQGDRNRYSFIDRPSGNCNF